MIASGVLWHRHVFHIISAVAGTVRHRYVSDLFQDLETARKTHCYASIDRPRNISYEGMH